MNGFKHCTILRNVEYSHVILLLKFWGSNEDKNNYYSNTNYTLSSLVREVKPMFEEIPEKISYNIAPLDLPE
jgi:hypothetical protein